MTWSAAASRPALSGVSPTLRTHPQTGSPMRLTSSAAGLFPIAPTPFTADGAIDHGSVETLIAGYLAAGATGVTVLGIMGEAPKLEPDEALDLTSRFIDGMPGLPVIVGVSAPGFAAMRSLARAVMHRGAAGVMIAPPPSLRTDDQIVGYYAQAVEAVGADVPFVIQDYPLTLTVQMTPKVIRRIVEDNPSCVMLKHEDWPGLEKISILRGFQAEGSMRPISILTGNGGLFLDFEMERGADGAMTGYAFPEMLADVARLQAEGHRDQAHDLFDAHLPLLRYEQQQGVGLAVRKYVMMRRGFIASDAQRKPGAALSAAAKAEVDYLLARLAAKDPRAAV
ncbi:dihydrodipicolinate synthetase [Methylopila sp. Yamaguchi]|nr:dihydrodipicolinate synthetase [Methylopila sp. Yamaguchi]